MIAGGERNGERGVFGKVLKQDNRLDELGRAV